MKTIKPIVFLLIGFLSACSTITFDNGSDRQPSITHDKWHHVVALDLVEVSDPVNLQNECSSTNWDSVTTETSFLNSLAGGVVNFIAPIWYPETVKVSCIKAM